MSEATRYYHEIKKRMAKLRALARQVKQQRREILENRELTPGAREAQLERLQAEGVAKHRKLLSEIEQIQKRADRHATDYRTNRPVEPLAVARVEKRLEGGVAISQIRERARELRDYETLAALRFVILYHGDKHGFVDADKSIAAIERDLAEIAPGEEASVNHGLVRLREIAQPVADVAEYSAKVQLGQDVPYDLLKVAYATGSGQDDDDA